MKRTQSDALHKKRFGQYFSGRKVADMLFSLLPKEYDWKTVVDPMVGIGDMLVTVQDHTSAPQMLGVEIDKIVAKDCATRLPDATIVVGDAFKAPELVAAEGWDCSCGQKGIVGNFCSNCGAKRPEAQPATWDCSCGRKGITGNFCDNCGKKKGE